MASLRHADTDKSRRPTWRRGRRRFTIERLEPRLPLDGSLVISELVADNQLGIKDDDGERSDWIEIYNSSDTPTDLSGWYLTDTPDDKTKWQFPSGSLRARQYLVVYASGKDRTLPSQPLHTNFRIDAGGEYLALVHPDGQTVESQFVPQFPNQFSDVSYGIIQNEVSATVISEGASLTYQVPPADDTLAPDEWTQVDFDDTSWATGSSGIGYDRRSDFDALLATDIEAEMYEINATLRMRIPFIAPSPFQMSGLLLRMKYDDGFVAYLNGQEVARRNAPELLGPESEAARTHKNSEAVEFEDVDLSEFAHLVREGANIFAIQGLNRSKTSSDLLMLPELMIRWPGVVQPGTARYFAEPTPGGPNGSIAFAGKVAAPRISLERGFFSEPQQVVLQGDTPGATIIYTTDGSTPSPDNGTQVLSSDPASLPIQTLDVSQTTILRVTAVRAEMIGSGVQTRTYVFLDDVIGQSADGSAPEGWPSRPINGQRFNYGMDPDVVNDPEFAPLIRDALTDIPSISIVTDASNLFDKTSGIYVNADNSNLKASEWERPTSVELLDPNGQAGFQIDAGLRIRGGASRSGDNPKHSFRLVFRGEYGATKLRFPIFGDEGADEFDNLDLRTAQARSWSWCTLDNDLVGNTCDDNTLVRDVFTRDTQRDMGQAYTRSRYYHLYLNGQYWGIYQTEERPEASFAETYFGGEAGDYDVVKVEAEPRSVVATDGTIDAWRQLWDMANLGFTDEASYFRAQGLDIDGVRDPSTPVLLDVDNLIDYMLLTFYVGNQDGPIIGFGFNDSTNNWFGIRNRDGESGFRFLAHDAEWGLGGLNDNRLGPWPAGTTFAQSNPQWIHQQLWENAEYRLRFADRAQRFLFGDGAATPAAALERMQTRIDQINLAIIAESARWGDTWREQPYTKNDWQAAVDDLVDNYLPQRTQIVIDQLRNAQLNGQPAPLYPDIAAPELSQLGGNVTPGFALELISPDTIYVTRDGSDPRQGAEVVSWDPLVAAGAVARYLVPTDDSLQADWTRQSFDDSGWSQGTTGIGFADARDEFPGLVATDIREGMLGENATVYLRISFQVDQPDQVQRLRMRMRFDDGFVAYLNGREVTRQNTTAEVRWNSRARRSRRELSSVELDISSLTDALQVGTNVLAIQGLNSNANGKDFLILPELDAGEVMDVNISPAADVYTDPIIVDSNVVVRARAIRNGQWSALVEALFSAKTLPLRINEIMYKPAVPTPNERAAGFVDDDDFEYLEFVNVSSTETLDLSDVTISQGIEFSFPAASLAPGERVVVARDAKAFVQRYGEIPELIGEYGRADGSNKLSNSGETLVVSDALGLVVQAVTYDDAWYPATDGDGQSLQIVDAGDPDVDRWSQAIAWRPSIGPMGSPGAAGRRIGDSNNDGIFNSRDLVHVLQAGEYEDGVLGNSTFDEGDWNQDGEFDSSDFVYALQTGTYVAASRRFSAEFAAAVEALFARARDESAR